MRYARDSRQRRHHPDGPGHEFGPGGHAQTPAEMWNGEKDAISHRGRALRVLVPILIDALSRGVDAGS